VAFHFELNTGASAGALLVRADWLAALNELLGKVGFGRELYQLWKVPL
jgi:hypothetical protein